jgi:hypothetical protein
MEHFITQDDMDRWRREWENCPSKATRDDHVVGVKRDGLTGDETWLDLLNSKRGRNYMSHVVQRQYGPHLAKPSLHVWFMCCARIQETPATVPKYIEEEVNGETAPRTRSADGEAAPPARGTALVVHRDGGRWDHSDGSGAHRRSLVRADPDPGEDEDDVLMISGEVTARHGDDVGMGTGDDRATYNLGEGCTWRRPLNHD